jgi:hypothetical protein
MISFLLLQKNLIKTTLLIHFDKTKWLWINLDEFKEFDFEVIIFHVIKEFSKRTWSIKNDIQLIMFLSRLFISAENNYWFIELETVELIWVIKKIRHLIQSSEKSVIIQTNHAVIVNICKQISITSINSVMRMNLRLIRVFQFLSQFSNLKIRHKSRKYHLISDALFRLQSLNKKDLSNDHAKLNEFFVDHNAVHVYNTTLMKLNSEFRKRIMNDYFMNESWKKIIQTIDQNAILEENAIELSFVRGFDTVSRESDLYMTSSIKSSLKISVSNHSNNKNLIYHVNKSTEEKRLCISSACVSDILAIAHEQDHSEFGVCFEIISRSWYIRELTKALRSYIKHCSQCLQIQIRRHKSWKNLQFIHSSSVSFHIIIMNFVLSLSKIKNEIDCVLSIIDKFTKRVMLISEKFIYTAENWAIHLLEETQRRDWDISKVIIFDRDRKFLFDLWRTLFTKLDVFMLYSTAYHSQTNDVSERTNQTLEIALRYYIQELFDSTLWVSALWKFQSIFNNTRSIVTGKISNELLYEITSNLSLNISFTNKALNHDYLRKKAQDAINWAQMQNKAHYDRRHTSLFLKIDEWVLLRLHHEYFVSSSKNMTKKIFAQYIESFKIIQRIERLIYRLNVSSDWKIHSVFFVAQLESASDSAKDFFNRSRSTHSSSVTDTQNEYEIERILNKRTVKRDHDYFIEYLIRWLNYESEWDRWYNVKNLANAKDLIVDYEKKLFNNFN